MKVAIAGAGAVGTFVANDLKEANHEVLLIEKSADLAARLQPSVDVAWYVGDACEVANLREAGIADADVMVAATGEDQVNLVISLLAKQEFAIPRVVARVNEPRNKWLFNETWGVDVAVSTPHLLTALIEEAVSVGSLVRLLEFEGGEASLIEVTLAEDSPANERTIKELGVPRDASIVAVIRQRSRCRAPGRHGAARRRRGPRPHHARLRGRRQDHPHRRGLTSFSSLQQLVERVVDLQAAALAGGRRAAGEYETLARLDPGDPTSTGPHGDELARAVGDRRLEPRSPRLGDDPDAGDLAHHRHGLAGDDLADRHHAGLVGTELAQLFLVEDLDGGGELMKEFLQCHRSPTSPSRDRRRRRRAPARPARTSPP